MVTGLSSGPPVTTWGPRIGVWNAADAALLELIALG